MYQLLNKSPFYPTVTMNSSCIGIQIKRRQYRKSFLHNNTRIIQRPFFIPSEMIPKVLFLCEQMNHILYIQLLQKMKGGSIFVYKLSVCDCMRAGMLALFKRPWHCFPELWCHPSRCPRLWMGSGQPELGEQPAQGRAQVGKALRSLPTQPYYDCMIFNAWKIALYVSMK